MGGMKSLLGDTPYESRYPLSPGYKEKGGTSEAAAQDMRKPAERLRDQVLETIKSQPGTADEVAARLAVSILSIRPRLSELRSQGKIAPSGARRPNASGKMATVWASARSAEAEHAA